MPSVAKLVKAASEELAVPLTPRWTPLKPHPVQLKWRRSTARFNVVPAGRRSGKTEIAKRRLVLRAAKGTKFPNARFFAAAPVRDQAKRLYWEDLKALVPKWLLAEEPREGELIIRMTNGSSIYVVGMDKPQRIEGSPWDGGILDEYADMKPAAWDANVRPALSDRMGWCDLIGVPEGRNHYHERFLYALTSGDPDWAAHTWKSADILPASEVEAARRSMDPLTFQQEYEAAFANFAGAAYYCFDPMANVSKEARYRPNVELRFCFDFNVSPGVAVVVQEYQIAGDVHTCVIGEVHIPHGSNTVRVCNRLVEMYKGHKAGVAIYGDATGGAPGSAKVAGSDWDLVKTHLRPAFGVVADRVPAGNPEERQRVVAMNTRLKNAAGEVRLFVNPSCVKTIRDLEGVRVLEGTTGDLDKTTDKTLTHLTDALGYEVWKEHGAGRGFTQGSHRH